MDGENNASHEPATGVPLVPVGTPAGQTAWEPPSATPSSGPSGGSTVVLPTTELPSRRGRSGRVVGAGLASVAVLLAGAFAVKAVTQDGGGADSPTGAAQAFFDALADEDVLGAMDAVLPGEQDAFRQPVMDVVDELKRLEVLGDGADLESMSGIDIEFRGLEFAEKPTNVPDIANVEVDGSATVRVEGQAIPIGDLLLDLADQQAPEETFTGEDKIEDYVFTTVREDGGWYVSLGYTAAERARWGDGIPGSGPDIPSVQEGVQPEGGATPEEGMDRMLDAVEGLDLEKLIATLNPNEFAPLQRYAPLFLDDAQQELDQQGLDVSIDDRSYTVDEDGETATLTLSAATVSVAMDGQEMELQWSDGCMSVSGTDMETQSLCAEDVASGSDSSVFGDLGLPSDEVGQLGETLSQAFSDFEGAGITMTKVDDQWYVSPIGTVTDTLVGVLRALDRQEIEDMVDAVESVMSSWTTSVDDTLSSDSYDTTTTGTNSFDAYFSCVNDVPDVEERAQCLRDGIAGGTIDPLFVTQQELFPECGLAERYSGGYANFSDLSDQEFIDLMTTAKSCFDGLVASGMLDADDFPMELRDISCYQGINPDAISDPDEYFDTKGEISTCLMDAG